MASQGKYSLVGLWMYAYLMCRSLLSTASLCKFLSHRLSSLISVVDLTLPLFLGRTSLWRLRSAVRADYRRFGFGGDDMSNSG